MSNVKALNADAVPTRALPKRIMRPCDYGLYNAVKSMEFQVGTVEAYNKMCDAAVQLKAKIDAGQAKKPADVWLTDPKYIYPAGQL